MSEAIGGGQEPGGGEKSEGGIFDRLRNWLRRFFFPNQEIPSSEEAEVFMEQWDVFFGAVNVHLQRKFSSGAFRYPINDQFLRDIADASTTLREKELKDWLKVRISEKTADPKGHMAKEAKWMANEMMMVREHLLAKTKDPGDEDAVSEAADQVKGSVEGYVGRILKRGRRFLLGAPWSSESKKHDEMANRIEGSTKILNEALKIGTLGMVG
jgi:hypothetical protein